MRFLGNIEARTDTKGRAFLPSAFRKVLLAAGEEALVLRKDIFERCLVIYPETVWNREMDEMRARLSRWDRRQQMVYRSFVSGVTSLSVDANGRILIPKPFLEAASIKQDIRFVGMGDTIEVWSNETDCSPFMDADEFGQTLEQMMAQGNNNTPKATTTNE